jgi:hypothetical protein
MDAVIILALIVALGVLANLVGRDSRPGPRAPEENLAALGFAWAAGGPRPRLRPALAPSPAPTNRMRHGDAGAPDAPEEAHDERCA